MDRDRIMDSGECFDGCQMGGGYWEMDEEMRGLRSINR